MQCLLDFNQEWIAAKRVKVVGPYTNVVPAIPTGRNHRCGSTFFDCLNQQLNHITF